MLSPEIIKNAEKAIATARAENFAKIGYNIYRDNRCQAVEEFIMEKNDGIEVLVSYDSITNTFTELKKLIVSNA